MDSERKTPGAMADREVVFEAIGDEDMLLISDFVSGTLSPRRRREVEQRLVSDPAFRLRADPVLWMHASTSRGGAPWLTEERHHEQWRTFRARAGLSHVPDPVLDNPWRIALQERFEAERRRRRNARRRIVAAIALLIVGVVAGIAWGPGVVSRLRGSRPRRAAAGPLTTGSMALVPGDTSVNAGSRSAPAMALGPGDTSANAGPLTVHAATARFRIERHGDSVATIEGIEGTVVARNSANPTDSLVVHPGERVRVRRGERPVRLPP